MDKTFDFAAANRRIGVLAAVCFFALCGEGRAIDCTKAATVAERLICSNPDLRKADDRLNNAFDAAMKAAPDREAKDAILYSQRRWIKARESYFGQEQQKSEAPAFQARMTVAVNKRIEWLSVRPTSDQEGLIGRIQKYRAFLSEFTGGAYAGNSIQCRMARSTDKEVGVEYICEGATTYQNGDRICRLRTDCGHGCVFEHDFRTVADVFGGEPRIRATCMTNHGNCPDDYDDGGPGWDREWTEKELYPLQEKQNNPATRRINTDAMSVEPWISFCLKDPNFPEKKGME